MILRLENTANPTTAGPVLVSTGTSLVTVIQAKPLIRCRVKGYSVQLQGNAAGVPPVFELIETDSASADTVTPFAAADITSPDNPDAGGTQFATLLDYGTSAKSGFSASVQGTVTTSRNLDTVLDPPTNQFFREWARGDESQPWVSAGKFLKLRVLAGTGVLCFASLLLDF